MMTLIAKQSPKIEVTVQSGFCEGHFPGNPIVAGAVQLAWVHDFIHREYGFTPSHLTLRSMKCLHELKPAARVHVQAEQSGAKLTATLTDGTTTYSDYHFKVPSATHVVAIPSFNTGSDLLQRTVREALAHWPRVWVFIDGSTDGSGEAIEGLQAKLPGLTVFRSITNRGKGSMAEWATTEAQKAGVSHLLIMDADGQHPAAAIPEFMTASLANPTAMILGQPVFGPEAPWIRLAGRKITIFLTNLETLGGGLGDTLFGFRVYPAAPMAAAFGETRRGARRYDFDPEMAVRLLWNNTPPIQLPAPVRYVPATEGGISHFHYLRDNLRMIVLHCRLLPAALIRMPEMLRRKDSGDRRQEIGDRT